MYSQHSIDTDNQLQLYTPGDYNSQNALPHFLPAYNSQNALLFFHSASLPTLITLLRRVGRERRMQPPRRRRSSWPHNSLDGGGPSLLNSQINRVIFLLKVMQILLRQSLGVPSVELPELSVCICLLLWFYPALFCVVTFISSSQIVVLMGLPIAMSFSILLFSGPC